jgi:hypothetical protein
VPIFLGGGVETIDEPIENENPSDVSTPFLSGDERPVRARRAFAATPA